MLRHGDIPSQLKGTAFGVLTRLCGTFQRLPDSCLIGEELNIDNGIPFATRTCADLWKGVWRGERVAVKLLRFSADDDRPKITKVRTIQAICSHPAVADAPPLVRGFAKRWSFGSNYVTGIYSLSTERI